jgi:hypothetical protein
MKMTPGHRALDKIYKRRDRYEIPEWQRGEVWNTDRKQRLIDSILRGWKLPKFYFVKLDGEQYEVVDGQQRLASIYEFFANELPLSSSSEKLFGGPHYKDLKQAESDAFDDFEIEFDEIEDASVEDLKAFFQRLQQGLPLTSSEKLNSVHSKLRDYAVKKVEHDFFAISLAASDKRLAHLDIASKCAAIEIEGIDAGFRYDDLKAIFESQRNFSPTSAVAKRFDSAVDFLARAFPEKVRALKNRTVAQSIITFVCRLVGTGRAKKLESKVASFVRHFVKELAQQVELGQAATDFDYIRFQKTINANITGGARTRQEILLRKAFMYDPELADAFDPSVLRESGIGGRVKELAESISEHIARINAGYSAAHGEDLFKATNKTAQALLRIGKPIRSLSSYSSFVGDLYFLFREGSGQRLRTTPTSFEDVNTLRTDLQHDVDHGKKSKVAAKKKKIGATFRKYSGSAAPELIDAERFLLVQANVLSALELDLTNLPVS